jgi:hypothetical protein
MWVHQHPAMVRYLFARYQVRDISMPSLRRRFKTISHTLYFDRAEGETPQIIGPLIGYSSRPARIAVRTIKGPSTFAYADVIGGSQNAA